MFVWLPFEVAKFYPLSLSGFLLTPVTPIDGDTED